MGASLWMVTLLVVTGAGAVIGFATEAHTPEPATVVTPEVYLPSLRVAWYSRERVSPEQLLAGAGAADPLAAWEATSVLAKGADTSREAREEAALLLLRLYNRHVDDEADKVALEGASDMGRLSLYGDQPL